MRGHRRMCRRHGPLRPRARRRTNKEGGCVCSCAAGWSLSSNGVSFLDTFLAVQLSAAGNNACVLKIDGTIACRGDYYEGHVAPPSGTFVQVSVGVSHSCGVKTDGTVAFWGDNDTGESTPPSGTFTQVAAGSGYTCGIRSDDKLICWGNCTSGQCKPPSGTFAQVAVGQNYACAVRTNGEMACWGDKYYAQSKPASGVFLQVAAYGQLACAVRSDGTVVCWGNNSNGFDSQFTHSPSDTFKQVAPGYYHVCGLRSDNAVLCWSLDCENKSTSPFGGPCPVPRQWRSLPLCCRKRSVVNRARNQQESRQTGGPQSTGIRALGPPAGRGAEA